MKAHLERLCEHCGIVRAGPGCDHYGAPFENAAVAVFEGKWATLKALAKKPTFAQLKATIKELAAHGFRMRWERSESDGMREVITKPTRQETFTMSASIPVDCKGRKCLSEATLALAPYPTAAQKPTTFPNGNPLPANTKIDNWWRFNTPAGLVAADGSRISYITYQYALHGMIMNALLKNPAKTWVAQNQDVHDYRAFLESYTGSPGDVATGAAWASLATSIASATGFPTVYNATHIAADVDKAQNDPYWNQTQ